MWMLKNARAMVTIDDCTYDGEKHVSPPQCEIALAETKPQFVHQRQQPVGHKGLLSRLTSTRLASSYARMEKCFLASNSR